MTVIHPGYVLVWFRSPDELRAHLDALNEDGMHPAAAGLDGNGAPFLIALTGCYADGEDVLFDSPWQTDIEWSNGRQRCDECLGRVHGLDDLTFPVAVAALRSADAAQAPPMSSTTI